jgi:hypothetical protein
MGVKRSHFIASCHESRFVFSAYYIGMDSEVAAGLRSMVRREEQKILDAFTHVERRIAVVELLRSMDLFYLWQNSQGEQGNDSEAENELILVYGWNKALEVISKPWTGGRT